MIHHGIVLNAGTGWDSGGVAFCALHRDPDGEVNLFYSGSQDPLLSHSELGLARATKSLEFERMKEPLLGDRRGSFCEARALTPAVTRVGGGYYMLFAGKPDDRAALRIGMACSDDPEGPWKILGEVAEPDHPWEGGGIDCGPGVVELDDRTRLFFYSNVTPLSLLSHRGLRSYIKGGFKRNYRRRIGLLKVRINGPSMDGIEIYKSGTPLSHLNGPVGSWRESLFCPGYLSLSSSHYLFVTCSNYSMGEPFRQSVALVRSKSAFFGENATAAPAKVIDGLEESKRVLYSSKSSLALDTPSPLLDDNRIIICYSAMDRSDGNWKIVASSASLRELGIGDRA